MVATGLGILAFLTTLVGVSAQEVPELQITSKRYIVIDADTGEVFAQRDADVESPMASLTKVFTTIEALEIGNLDQTITTYESDVFDPGSSTVMGFGSGESFTLQDLLYGMILPSGNDAAHAVARALGTIDGGSDGADVANFVSLMNKRIGDMGLTETHLIRPDGWGVKGHFSSAHDLAIFTMYAMKYPMFVDLISTPSYTTTDGSYTVSNTNKMLNTYPGIVGGKTGFDEDAGYCLIEVAKRDGNTMISVTLDGVAPDDWYDDNRVLLDYAFEQKADRTAKKAGVTGEVLSYRDPDAVNVLAMATPGVSIGLPKPTGTPLAASGTPALSLDAEKTKVAIANSSDSGDSGGLNGKLLIAVVVTAVVIVAGVFGSVATSASSRRLSKGD